MRLDHLLSKEHTLLGIHDAGKLLRRSLVIRRSRRGPTPPDSPRRLLPPRRTAGGTTGRRVPPVRHYSVLRELPRTPSLPVPFGARRRGRRVRVNPGPCGASRDRGPWSAAPDVELERVPSVHTTTPSLENCRASTSIFERNSASELPSYEEPTVDALAPDADEGRGWLRKATGSCRPSIDPWISEWGNPAGVMPSHPCPNS